MAERSVITELKVTGLACVTCVLIEVYRDPRLIFLQYFKPNGYFQAINISDWTDHFIVYITSFVHMISNQMMAAWPRYITL